MDKFTKEENLVNMICFHMPDERNGYLSNWYMSDFWDAESKYSCMEQYMMYHKALLFGDIVISKRILSTNKPAEIKKLGREVKNFNQEIWDKNKQNIVFEGLLFKFTQNKDIKNALLKTKDKTLVECAMKDKVWGNGCSMSSKDRLDKNKWKGENLLGQLIERVRDTIMYGNMN